MRGRRACDKIARSRSTRASERGGPIHFRVDIRLDQKRVLSARSGAGAAGSSRSTADATSHISSAAAAAESPGRPRSLTSRTRTTSRRPRIRRQPHRDRHVDSGVAQLEPGEPERSVRALKPGPQRRDRGNCPGCIRKPAHEAKIAMCRPLRMANSANVAQPPHRPSRRGLRARTESSNRRRTRTRILRANRCRSAVSRRTSRAQAIRSGVSATGASHVRLKRGKSRISRTAESSESAKFTKGRAAH